ncbi:MAG: helix-turn-helix domain-containing protein [Candidatus Paceibacterota bacterium]|jgi:sugar-specific transcriptional regulator TrmB
MIEIPQEIKKTLNEIGLDRTESQVYVLLLKKGLLSIQEITKELSLPRSSVHLACEGLLARGVAKVSMSNKRRSFYIEQPKDIEKFLIYEENELTSKKSALNSILPKLTAIYAVAKESEPIDVEELQGENGFVETFYRSLNQPKNSEVLRFGSDPDLFTIARDRLVKYREQRMKKKICSRLLQPESHLSTEEIKDARFKMREVRVLPKEFYDPKLQMSTWADNVAITVWDKGLHSVIIRNKAIADFIQQIFEIIWKQADKNK